jgi:hypothetical protein
MMNGELERMLGIPPTRVTTYGGEWEGGFQTVQHWQLIVDGQFVADSSTPQDRRLYERIVEAINAGVPPSGKDA